ncbi:hypothetical protein QBC39DRAFT_40632 [Podospora conica]|nr:hypothetical protein QBC39DRAFT_40632 [Schizothecium conicum]
MDTNEMDYRMSSDPSMLESSFPQSRGCPYFNRGHHDHLPSLSHPQAHMLAHPPLSQHHYHLSNNSGTTYGGEINYNHLSRPHPQSAGQPQHTPHPRTQPPHANHGNNSNNNNNNSTNHNNASHANNHTNHPHPRLPLPPYDPVHANGGSSSSSNAWYQPGQNPNRHIQTHLAVTAAPPSSQMNTSGNPAAGGAAGAAGAPAADAAAAAAASGNAGNAGSAPDGHFGRGGAAGLGLGSGPGTQSGAPSTGRGPAAGNPSAAGGGFHSVLAQPGGVTAPNGGHQGYPYGAPGPGGLGPYHFSLSAPDMSRGYPTLPPAFAPHMNQPNYHHHHHPQHHNQHQHQSQQQQQQQQRHQATGSIDRSSHQPQPVSNLRGPSLPALNPPFHAAPISGAAMATESPASAESSPNATPPHAHDIFYSAPGESRRRLAPPLAPPLYRLSAAGELARAEAAAQMAPSSTEQPASAHSSDSSPTAEHRRNQARSRLGAAAALQAEYDSGDDPYDIGDMVGDEEETMRFIDQIHHDTGGVTREARHNTTEERRIREQQVLRGQMSTKRVASKKALAQLQSVDIASLDESEKTCVICYNEFGIPNPEGIQETPLRLPNCQHIFGEHCIKKWFEESDSCPYCRDKVHSESVAVPSNTVRQYLQRYGRHIPPLMRHGGALPQSSHNSGGGDSPPRTWQTGDRRSPPSDPPEARRRTRSRLNSARLSASSMPLSQSTTQSSQTQLTAHDRVNAPHTMPSWAAYVGPQTHHVRQAMQRMPYSFSQAYTAGYTAGTSFMPPMHMQPSGMPPGQGHQSLGFGFHHGQLNHGEDMRYQAPPTGGGAPPTSEAMHMAYSHTLPPVGALDGGSLPPAIPAALAGHGHQNRDAHLMQ